jgi:hypothetical protein
VVDAGASGQGTFSFSSMAASPIEVESLGGHSMTTLGGIIKVDLGGPMDGNLLNGWFNMPDGRPFGAPFQLFDDGVHGDGLAGDGRFASEQFVPPAAGAAYLGVEGESNGEAITRFDLAVFSFQPEEIRAPGRAANYGGSTPVTFEVHNLDSVDHCYYLALTCRPTADGRPVLHVWQGAALDTVQVYLESGVVNNTLPSEMSGILTISAVGRKRARWRLGQHDYPPRSPASIDVFNSSRFLRPNGNDAITLNFGPMTRRQRRRRNNNPARPNADASQRADQGFSVFTAGIHLHGRSRPRSTRRLP